MSKIRIICVEVDSGNACNVGGPVCITHKTFEVEAPPGMTEWIAEPTTKKWSFNVRSVVGVEVLPVESPRIETDEMTAELVEACKSALAVLPGLEVRSWPPGHAMKRDAIEKITRVLNKAEPLTGEGK